MRNPTFRKMSRPVTQVNALIGLGPSQVWEEVVITGGKNEHAAPSSRLKLAVFKDGEFKGYVPNISGEFNTFNPEGAEASLQVLEELIADGSSSADLRFVIKTGSKSLLSDLPEKEAKSSADFAMVVKPSKEKTTTESYCNFYLMHSNGINYDAVGGVKISEELASALSELSGITLQAHAVATTRLAQWIDSQS